jgi:hypothetical protein
MRIFAALILVVALNTGAEAQRLICFGIGVTFCKPIGEHRCVRPDRALELELSAAAGC